MEDKILKFLEESKAELLEKHGVKEFLEKKPEIKRSVDDLLGAFKNYKERTSIENIKILLDKSIVILDQIKYAGLLDQIPPDIRSKMEGVIEGDKSVVWYYSKNEALNGKSPYDIAKTRKGKEEVKSLLGRLEWGIFE